mgnify:CR=1 FL=1
MPRRANTQTQQEAVQENAAVQANAGADMQMEATITKTQPEMGVLALADVKIGDFMTIRNVRKQRQGQMNSTRMRCSLPTGESRKNLTRRYRKRMKLLCTSRRIWTRNRRRQRSWNRKKAA